MVFQNLNFFFLSPLKLNIAFEKTRVLIVYQLPLDQSLQSVEAFHEIGNTLFLSYMKIRQFIIFPL